VRHRIKYRLPSQKHPANFLYWLLALALAVALALLWWESGKKSQPKPEPRAVTAGAARPPEPRQVAAPPPISPPTNAGPMGLFPRPVQTIIEAQVALVQQGISPGSLDGAIGSQTRAALAAFQQNENLPLTGQLDAATKSRPGLDRWP